MLSVFILVPSYIEGGYLGDFLIIFFLHGFVCVSFYFYFVLLSMSFLFVCRLLFFCFCFCLFLFIFIFVVLMSREITPMAQWLCHRLMGW